MNGITLTPIGYRPCYSPGLYGPVGATYRSAKKTTRARTPELPMTTTLELMTHAEGDWAGSSSSTLYLKAIFECPFSHPSAVGKGMRAFFSSSSRRASSAQCSPLHYVRIDLYLSGVPRPTCALSAQCSVTCTLVRWVAGLREGYRQARKLRRRARTHRNRLLAVCRKYGSTVPVSSGIYAL